MIKKILPEILFGFFIFSLFIYYQNKIIINQDKIYPQKLQAFSQDKLSIRKTIVDRNNKKIAYYIKKTKNNFDSLEYIVDNNNFPGFFDERTFKKLESKEVSEEPLKLTIDSNKQKLVYQIQNKLYNYKEKKNELSLREGIKKLLSKNIKSKINNEVINKITTNIITNKNSLSFNKLNKILENNDFKLIYDDDLLINIINYLNAPELKINSAVAISDISTGELLVLSGYPSMYIYDYDQKNQNMNNEDTIIYPFYKPASTFKALTTLAYLESEPLIDNLNFNYSFKEYNNGNLSRKLPKLRKVKIMDHKTRKVILVDIYTAFPNSTNGYFIDFISDLKDESNNISKKFLELQKKFGYKSVPFYPLDDVEESDRKRYPKTFSIWGNEKNNEKILKIFEPSYDYYSKYYFEAQSPNPVYLNTPKLDQYIPCGLLSKTGILQTLNIASTIGNNGFLLKPKLIKDNSKNSSEKIIKKTQTIELMKYLMRSTSKFGTYQQALNKKIDMDIAIKTGTGNDDEITAKSVIIGFYPVEKPKYAFSVIVNSTNSATRTLSKKIVDEIFRKEEFNKVQDK